jgi:hypothetical protein
MAAATHIHTSCVGISPPCIVSTGDAHLDGEHVGMLDTITSLESQLGLLGSDACPCVFCRQGNHGGILATLDSLLAQLSRHNAREGQYALAKNMENTANWKSHLEKHRQFHDFVYKMREDACNCVGSDCSKKQDFLQRTSTLRQGLISHINTEDARDMHFG